MYGEQLSRVIAAGIPPSVKGAAADSMRRRNGHDGDFGPPRQVWLLKSRLFDAAFVKAKGCFFAADAMPRPLAGPRNGAMDQCRRLSASLIWFWIQDARI
jgi:hypothetical protein